MRRSEDEDGVEVLMKSNVVTAPMKGSTKGIVNENVGVSGRFDKTERLHRVVNGRREGRRKVGGK